MYLYFVHPLENKKKWIDPKVIELVNSDSENDLDFIPPSPTPEEISPVSQTRFVPSIHHNFALLPLMTMLLHEHNNRLDLHRE